MKIPYFRPSITTEELISVENVLASGWLTSGKGVLKFEEQLSVFRMNYPCIAVNSCTSALFLLLHHLKCSPGDEVITTPFTFPSTANIIHHNQLKPVFADINPKTLNIDPESIERVITPKTKAIIPVHIGGNPCEMDEILALANKYGLEVIEDCAHALESEYNGKPLGSFGVGGAFSFYATKNITTGEGGMILSQREGVISELKKWRLHGLDKNTWERESDSDYVQYDVSYPGFKCNMTDFQAALGIAQLSRVEEMYQKRVELNKRYNNCFSEIDGIQLIEQNPEGKSALHLYILKISPEKFKISRNELIRRIQERGIHLSVNYKPVHLFSWYQNELGYRLGDFPNAEQCGQTVISLPFYPDLTEVEISYVLENVKELLKKYAV